jgi:hypothetical protein
MIDLTQEYSFLNGAWHLAYYIPSNRPTGSLSDNILKFKDNYTHYVNCWSRWSLAELSSLGVRFDYIIRALGSSELTVSRTRGLDTLGVYLEANLPSIYCPEVLQKSRLTPPMHTLRTKPERQAAIHDSYFVADRTRDFNNKNILIIDDVTTSRTTIKEILRALKVVWSNGHYHLFCLGRTIYDHDANNNIPMTYFR